MKINRLEDIKNSDIGKSIQILFGRERFFPKKGHFKEIVESGKDKEKSYVFLIQTHETGIPKISLYNIFNAKIKGDKLIPFFYSFKDSIMDFSSGKNKKFPRHEQYQEWLKIIEGEIK